MDETELFGESKVIAPLEETEEDETLTLKDYDSGVEDEESETLPQFEAESGAPADYYAFGDEEPMQGGFA